MCSRRNHLRFFSGQIPYNSFFDHSLCYWKLCYCNRCDIHATAANRVRKIYSKLHRALSNVSHLSLFLTLSVSFSSRFSRGLTFLGLILIIIGSGGIKPCVAAFGGDQFVLPQQLPQMATYFSVFYFSINAGSLISTILTPILRQDIPCFGELECFSLAFGVPGVLMVISISK